MGSIHFTTAASLNYLAAAVVALESALITHPEASASIYLYSQTEIEIADLQRRIPHIRVDSNEAIIDYQVVRSMRNYYSDIEFFSALKIFNLKQNRLSAAQVVHIDTDTLFLERLFDNFGDFTEVCIQLVPHCQSPYPRSQIYMRDLDLIRSGTINGGLISFFTEHPVTDFALDWLLDHAQHHFFVSQRHGLYADQSWLSLLPTLFPDVIQIVKDPGINMAYWNLHERTLTGPDENMRFYVNTEHVLKMFHFSGYHYPSRELSVHVPKLWKLRYSTSLESLIDNYRTRIAEAKMRLAGLPIDSRRSLATRFGQIHQRNRRMRAL